jgi:hypothetical protein
VLGDVRHDHPPVHCVHRGVAQLADRPAAMFRQPAARHKQRLGHDRFDRMLGEDRLAITEHAGGVVDEHALKGAADHRDAGQADQLRKCLADRLTAEILGRPDRMVHRTGGLHLGAIHRTGVPVHFVATCRQFVGDRELRRDVAGGRHRRQQKTTHEFLASGVV